ncbi:ATP-binding cassette domain-containing protein [Salmonella enterica]|nr:ATP-binding cassette domain-containing protein [Salmonella enterica]
MLFQSLKIYFSREGIGFNDSDARVDCSQSLILKNINNFLPESVYFWVVHDFIYEEGMYLPLNFIVESMPGDFSVIDSSNGSLIKISKNGIENYNASLNGRRVIYFQKKISERPVSEISQLLERMAPKTGYISAFFIVFAVMSPLYSNIFNTRLVYSDAFNSVLFISVIFIAFLLLEVVLRHHLHGITVRKIRANNIFLNDYFVGLLKVSKCRDVSIKIRMVDLSSGALWTEKPLLVMDFIILMLFSIAVILMLGLYSIPLFVYYVIYALLCLQIRFKNYKNTCADMEYSSEKNAVFHLLEINKLIISFYNRTSLLDYVRKQIIKEEDNKIKININNHHWGELIKANSFISMIIMYFSCYFSVSNGEVGVGSIIAIMIINSRLSASITSIAARYFSLKIYRDHVLSSLSACYKDLNRGNKLYIDNVNDVIIKNLSCSLSGRLLINNMSLTFNPGDVVGVYGRSGSGKTTLLKIISGFIDDYSGEVTISGVSVNELSRDFFSDYTSFYSSSSFIKGTLRDNFLSNGVKDTNKINEIMMSSIKNCTINSTLYDGVEANDTGFSNGEKQKIQLGMMIKENSKIIFLDEPTSFLPADDGYRVVSEIINKNRGAIIFIATHDSSLMNLMTRKINLDVSDDSLSVNHNKNRATINVGFLRSPE